MESFDFLKLLSLFKIKRNRLIAGISAALVFIIGTIFIVFSMPQYIIDTIFMIEKEEKNNISASMQLLLGDMGTQAENEMTIIKSRTVLNKLASELNMQYEVTRKNNIFLMYISDKLFGYKDIYGSIYFLKAPKETTGFSAEITATATGFSISSKKGESVPCLWETPCQFDGSEIQLTKLGNIPDGTVYETSFRNIIITRETLLKSIKTENSGDGGDKKLLRIEYKTGEPFIAVKLLETLLDVYDKTKVGWKVDTAKEKQQFIEKILARVKSDLQLRSEELAGYQAKKKTILPSIQLQAVMQQHVEADRQRDIVDMKEKITKLFLEYIEVGKDKPLSLPVLLDDASLQNMVKEHNSKILKYREYETLLTENHPDIISMREQIEKGRESIRQLLSTNLQQYEKAKQLIDAQTDTLDGMIKTLPEDMKNITMIQRDLVLNEKLYAFLIEKYYEATITMSTEKTSMRILDRPTHLTQKDSPKFSISFIVLFFTSIFIALFIIIIIEFLRKTVASSEELRQISGFPVLAQWDGSDSALESATALMLSRSSAKSRSILFAPYSKMKNSEEIAVKIAQSAADNTFLVILDRDRGIEISEISKDYTPGKNGLEGVAATAGMVRIRIPVTEQSLLITNTIFSSFISACAAKYGSVFVVLKEQFSSHEPISMVVSMFDLTVFMAENDKTLLEAIKKIADSVNHSNSSAKSHNPTASLFINKIT